MIIAITIDILHLKTDISWCDLRALEDALTATNRLEEGDHRFSMMMITALAMMVKGGQQCCTQHQPLGQRSRAKLRKQTLCGAQTILSRLQDKVYDKPNVSLSNESWDLVLAKDGKSSTNVFSKVTSQSQGCPHNGVERRSSLCKVISVIIGVVAIIVIIVIITRDTIQTKTQLLQKLNSWN